MDKGMVRTRKIINLIQVLAIRYFWHDHV